MSQKTKIILTALAGAALTFGLTAGASAAEPDYQGNGRDYHIALEEADAPAMPPRDSEMRRAQRFGIGPAESDRMHYVRKDEQKGPECRNNKKDAPRFKKHRSEEKEKHYKKDGEHRRYKEDGREHRNRPMDGQHRERRPDMPRPDRD